MDGLRCSLNWEWFEYFSVTKHTQNDIHSHFGTFRQLLGKFRLRKVTTPSGTGHI